MQTKTGYYSAIYLFPTSLRRQSNLRVFPISLITRYHVTNVTYIKVLHNGTTHSNNKNMSHTSEFVFISDILYTEHQTDIPY